MNFVTSRLPLHPQKVWPRRSCQFPRHCALTFHQEIPLGPTHVEDPVAIPIDELHRLTRLSSEGAGPQLTRFAPWSTVSSTAIPLDADLEGDELEAAPPDDIRFGGASPTPSLE